MDKIGIRATDRGLIAFDLPAINKTIEMEIEDAVRFAASIGEIAQIAAAQRGMALIIDQGGEPRLVHESVLSAIEAGMPVVLGGEVLRATGSSEAAGPEQQNQEP